uniref:NADH-ubiquinone oxidoreductase chain 1 n=1 Tax=Nereis zonata TaxID=880888 RepID=A0A7M3UIY3_9ANNE|nr:NADH dehydrogenase subunit 1 [Nereis zonata]QOH99548.1 NADH dehydrogenase subunit 1 [Nereis zonata]
MWHPAVYLITTFISALLAMAFFTLLERKFLGYAQLRKGPNKVSVGGIPQPMADALKLFTKELNTPTAANYTPFLAAPMMALLLALMVWTLYPHLSSPLPLKWGILMFLALSSMNVYTTLFSGWASNSKYSLLGALRSIAQTISYEVSMALIILTPMIMMSSLSLNSMSTNYSIMFMVMMWPLYIMWIITALAETNRTPFDLAEGESELVSGFNTEYSSGTFALIFMAEYMNIIAMGMISWAMFMSVSLSPVMDIIMVASLFTVSLMFIWARSAYPRMRYDKLMGLTWKQFLPLTLTTIMIMAVTSL